ncbi:tetratricopeptide repeat protein [Pseudactinotalea sp. Z1739]|uniref:tetratricopeptide repeat protein n=1 Tax=Pseudactinotalea sp. Z1739 TaxID=3413028 RepID=UPI003C7B3DB9
MSDVPANALFTAQTLMASGRWPDARRILVAILATTPDHPGALVAMAECALGLGEPDEALRAAAQAVAQHPLMVAPLIVRPRALSAVGRHDESRQSADAAIRLDPHGYLGHLQRASADAHARKVTTAGRASMQTVLRLAPNEPDAHVVAGNLSLARGNLAAAQRSYQTALGLDPDNKAAQYNLAIANQHTFGWATSARLLRGLIRMDPTDSRYTIMLRSLLSLMLVIAALYCAVLIMLNATPGPDRPDPDATRMLLVLGGCLLLQGAAVLWVRRIGGRSVFQFLAPGRLGTGWRTNVLYLAAAGIALVDLCLLMGALFVDIAGTLAGIAMLFSMLTAGLVIASMAGPRSPSSSPSSAG